MKKIEREFHGRTLSIEVGRLAKQAGGSALVQYGETVVLVTATAARDAREGIDFFPLTVDYQEKTFAAGKIPGGFFKREGRLGAKEVLTSRLIDRPLRPLFPDGFRCETQIVATVLSYDKENEADVLSLIGASMALEVSDIPFDGPVAGIRVGRVEGTLVVNPTLSQLESSDLQMIMAGTPDAIVMVEGGANVVAEDVVLDALYLGHEAMQPLFEMQAEIKAALGKPKRSVTAPEVDSALVARVRELAKAKLATALAVEGKHERNDAVREVRAGVLTALAADYPDRDREIKHAFEAFHGEVLRQMIVAQRKRIDGRGLTDIRPISCDVQLLPRAHGSAVFTRGETQALVVATLGTSSDEQKIDALGGEFYKKFMLHYNFPPYCVGEVKFLRGPSRREIGHGNLAERAVQAILPDPADFPYTIRVVSEILESNGSSSMATVCGSSLALMDAGVPIKGPVAGIAMGLIREGEDVRVLSDILGDEDHLGDMDFKVAGTAEGVTAVQMDIKIGGVTREIMRDALYQARDGRLHILNCMKDALAQPRGDMSIHAPRITTLKIKVDRIRDVIGPGGKVIRGIIEETGVKIDVEDDGTIFVASSDGDSMQQAIDWIQRLTAEAEVGKIYKGVVKKIMDFGAFVEILPGTDGLVHISQLAPERVQKVRDVVNEGDEVMVKVLEVDRSGKIRLSRKDAMGAEAGAATS
jgi:polyribonucleotide nucleotidyltransferase